MANEALNRSKKVSSRPLIADEQPLLDTSASYGTIEERPVDPELNVARKSSSPFWNAFGYFILILAVSAGLLAGAYFLHLLDPILKQTSIF
jgi:hypothetical protein